MNEINSKSTSKETLLYMYILGTGNERDYLRGVVPYRINNEELFYGPCKRPMREEIKSLWDERKNEKNKMPKIFIVGINPSKNSKLKARKILFAGEVLEIFTFKEAWEHYKKIISTSLNEDYRSKVEKMINGIKSKKGTIESPLLLKPDKDEKGREGYKHQTDMHKNGNKWLNDILSSSERNLFSKTNDEKYPKEIYKNEKISFKRDCCFKLKNIHFSSKKKQCPIELTNEMFKLIKPEIIKKRPNIEIDNLKPPDIYSPFGYNKDDQKYGGVGKHIVLRNAKAERLIQLLIENK